MASPTSKEPRSNPSQRPASGPRLKAAPVPAPSPLAALVAGLAALIEAHQASATSGAALVLWQVLASLHAMASRVLAAPSAFALEAIDDGPLTAGLMLREKGVPAGGATPRISSVHRDLIGHALELVEELDEARSNLQGIVAAIQEVIRDNLSNETRPWLLEAEDCAERATTAVRLAEGSICVLSHHLTSEDATSPPARHASALARIWMATSENRDALNQLEIRRAARAFASASP